MVLFWAPFQAAFAQEFGDPEYKKFIKDNLYVIGLYRGASGINTYLIEEKKDPIFCIPPKVASDERYIVRMLEEEIAHPTYSKKYQYTDVGAPTDMVVASTLAKKFPCGRNKVKEQ